MTVSPVALLKERERRIYTSDQNFYRKFVYFFELRVPARLTPGSGGQFFFPLALAPTQYSMGEPFSVEVTPTQGGGVYVEENGIIMRTIKLSGHTGFKPRSLGKLSAEPAGNTTSLIALKPEKRSFGRRLRSTILRAISGQKHFQYLQDAVFRTYADLKRDPATSEDTSLIFHNPKDEESWIVIPQNLGLDRNAAKRVLYQYDIELLAIDRAESIDYDLSEDKDLLDNMRDGVRMVASGVSLAGGALNDLTSLENELTGTVQSIGTIIDNATTVINAATSFVNGGVRLIESPYALLNATTDLIDAALYHLYTLEESNDAIRKMPDNVVQKMRQLADGLDRIGVHPEAFETSSLDQLSTNKRSQELLQSVSTDRASTAASSIAPATYDEVEALGTALTPGDVESAAGELGVGRTVYNFTGSTLVTITQGDSLASLAAKYLGDARLWQHLAAINGLKPPFVSEQANVDLTAEERAFPGVLGIGNTILVPSFEKAPQDLPLIPVLGVTSDEAPEVHLLGTDLALEAVSGRPGAVLYDVPIDVEGGSTGPKLVAGVPNIVQGLTMRMSTDKGSDVLYKRVGLDRVIGSNFVLTDVESARFKFTSCLDQDPRVSSIRRLDFEDSLADALVIDADVELRGFTATVNVKAEL